MKTLLSLSIAAALWLPPAAWAQSIQERGRQIVADAIDALGGDAFLKMETTAEQGRVFSYLHTQLSGFTKATIYFQYLPVPAKPGPDKVYMIERMAFGDDEAWFYQYTTDDAFEVTFRGARPMDKATVERVQQRRAMDVFYLLRRFREPGMIFEYRTTEVIDNNPLVKVDITDPDYRTVSVWFHRTTKLPMRSEFRWRDQDRIPHDERTVYDKYLSAGGGITLPHVVERYRDGERTFSLFADSVVANPPNIASKFELPAAAQILERER